MFPSWLSSNRHLIFIRVAWKGVEVGDPWGLSRPEGEWSFDSTSGLAEKFIGHLIGYGMLRLDIELDEPVNVSEEEYGRRVRHIGTLKEMNNLLRRITKTPRSLVPDIPFAPVE